MIGDDMERRKKSAVAFDLDGLMFDTEGVHAKAADLILKGRGRRFTPEIAREIMGRRPEENLRRFIDRFSLPDSVDDLLRETVDTTIGLLERGVAPMPGLTELLDALDSRGIPRCVCSSGLPRIVREILARGGVSRRVDFVLTSADVTRGKPDPEIYVKAAERFGISPERMLVLEDSAPGCAAAVAAGSVCCMLRAAHNSDADFSQAAAVVERLDAPELLAFLD